MDATRRCAVALGWIMLLVAACAMTGCRDEKEFDGSFPPGETIDFPPGGVRTDEPREAFRTELRRALLALVVCGAGVLVIELARRHRQSRLQPASIADPPRRHIVLPLEVRQRAEQLLSGLTTETQQLRERAEAAAAALDYAPAQSPAADPTPVRARGIIDMRTTRELSVLLLGAGAIGSHVAADLAPYGFGLTVIDRDVVEPGNVEGDRTIYAPTDVGKWKAVALKDRVEARYPLTPVIPVSRDVASISDDELRLLATGSNLLIVAIDDAEQVLRINRFTYGLTTALYVAFHRRAQSGHVVKTEQGRPCFECAVGIGEGRPLRGLDGEPGIGIDIRFVASACAKMALQLLTEEQAPQLGDTFDRRYDLALISNRISDVTNRGFGVAFRRARRRPSCLVCNPPGERR